MGTLAALGAAFFYGLSSFLQHREARALPSAGSVNLMRRLVQNPGWLGGLAAGAGAVALQAVALAVAPLSQVQPLLTTGLLFALGIGAAASGVRLRGREWAWAVCLVAGLAGFLAIGSPHGGAPPDAAKPWVLLGLASAGAIAAAVALSRRAGAGLRAPLLGGAGGLALGVSSALLKASLSVPHGGLAAILSRWPPYALLAAGLAGIVLTQMAFQAGPMVSSLPAISVVEPLAGTAIGVLMFSERLSSSLAAVAGETVCAAAMLAGIVVLARVPWPAAAGPRRS